MTHQSSTRTHSRRAVLKAAAAGSATIGLVAAGKAIGGTTDAATVGEGAPIVAYVSDARTGELTVMVGTREVIRRDRGLVSRLVAIAKEAGDVVTS